jgi:hypothetical protein
MTVTQIQTFRAYNPLEHISTGPENFNAIKGQEKISKQVSIRVTTVSEIVYTRISQ